MNGSPPFRLAWSDVVKILKGAMIAVIGAALSALVVEVAKLGQTDYAWLIPLITVGINMLRKFLLNTLEYVPR